MVDLASLAGFNEDADSGSQFLPDERVMDGSRREQRADRDSFGRCLAVGENDQRVAVFNRLGGFLADSLDRRSQSGRAFTACIGRVDRFCFPAAPLVAALVVIATAVERLDGGQFRVGENRMRNAEAVALLFRRVEQIAFRADVALKAHDDVFADRIDGRVRDLREELLEVVVGHASLVRQHGQGRVVAH